jgi:DNA-binding CsgD family transcriptional regulator
MMVRRVLLVDPCRFTRSALSQVLQRQGLIVDAREREPDDLLDDQRALALVVSALGAGASTVTLYREGREPVVLDRANLSLGLLLDLLVRDQDGQSHLASEVAASAVRLTVRQREVLSEVARGLSSRVIAERLGIHAKTVEHHKANIYEKLNVQNQAQAVATALREGLVDG